jgi:beta-lactamase regulating signal transducer with metallopeptidase domain
MFRPVLVLPEGLAGALEPDELRQVLLHELAHVKRGDLILDWFPAIARLLFFFHPVAHWAAGRILLERELACDQAAINLSNHDAASYARMLVRVATVAAFPLPAPATANTLGINNFSSHDLASEDSAR